MTLTGKMMFSQINTIEEPEFKQFAKLWLNKLGFKVKDIPCKNSKTPDFDVSGQNDKYTFELKIKEDDPEKIKEESEALHRGEIVRDSTPIGPRNKLYGIYQYRCWAIRRT